MNTCRDATVRALVLIGFAGLTARRIARLTSPEFYWRCSRRVAAARSAGRPVWHICDRTVLCYQEGAALSPQWRDPVFSIANDDALKNLEFAAMIEAVPTELEFLVGPGCEGYALRSVAAAHSVGIDVAVERVGECKQRVGGVGNENNRAVRRDWANWTNT